MFIRIAYVSEKQTMLTLKFKIESDCFENGLNVLSNLSGARYFVSRVKTSLQKLTSGSFSLLVKFFYT